MEYFLKNTYEICARGGTRVGKRVAGPQGWWLLIFHSIPFCILKLCATCRYHLVKEGREVGRGEGRRQKRKK
jgi:hypothetical protein